MKLFFACLLAARMASAQTPAASFDDLAHRAEAALDRNPAEAATLYKQALELQPSWPEGWFYLGGALYRLNRCTEGLDAFHKGLNLSQEWHRVGLSGSV
jgi:cytochrome c-type biogenesis protein CcmH/NrfG